METIIPPQKKNSELLYPKEDEKTSRIVRIKNSYLPQQCYISNKIKEFHHDGHYEHDGRERKEKTRAISSEIAPVSG
jgi:hypothetical protein